MFDLGIVVPVRRGSSRIREKTLLPFGEEATLLEWKLSQLVTVIDPARIYLSTEDDAFLAMGDRFGVRRHKRDLHLAQDHIAPFRDVITGIVRDIPHDHIAWCTVVCPLMPPSEYLEAFRAYRDQVLDGAKDSLVGVNLTKEYFWEEGRSLNYEATRNHTISQDLPDWFKVTNSIYMRDKASILRDEYFIGPAPVLHQLSKLSGIDIDYMEDYRMAQALYAIYQADGLGTLPSDAAIAWPAA
ncbi:hypothetical protein [Sphingomonas sp. C3-2]|uniref:acylneuraminate cytidylyltransferase family protein n=1 Tax=Sphingomonas sp. C3-2 TaxID=3062169 RepID=UPI00294B7724|nr:hypothetical protein [Sphingomonas sp. C3-2]WOK37987.1 hypothetical protein QYC26_07355 [Sphingomonas sp. C3-2]